MATLTFSLPDELFDAAQRRLALECAEQSIEEYVLSALHGLAGESRPVVSMVEALVVESFSTPLLDASQVDWDRKLNRLTEQK